MTAFAKPSFSVNPSGAKAPADCRHGWIDAKKKCVLCGKPNVEKPEGIRRQGISRFRFDARAKR